MLQSLPYDLPELVTRAPLDTHRSTVLPEWVDWNGHMNVAFYVKAFDQASGAFMRNMGLGRRYVDVTDLAFCVDYLERWGKRNAA